MKVGIAGHQNIGSGEILRWVKIALNDCISQLTIEQGFTSLAIGADQLFAQILNNRNIPFTVIIPCEGYEQTFQNSIDLEIYNTLLNVAANKIKLPFDKPNELAFYEAGKRIVDVSELLIAIWNGQPAKGLGGTGDIVKYALSMNKSILHINPITFLINRM